MDEREQAHYYHTLADFINLIQEYGVGQVAHDFKQANPIAFEQMQKTALIDRDKDKRAALLKYNETMAAVNSIL